MYYNCLRFCFFLLFNATTSLLAQTTAIDIGQIDFTINQDAVKIDERCYQLTPNKSNSVGRVWYPDAIDIRADFLLDFEVFLGCNDEDGADGLVLILNQKPILGLGGPPMGRPSLGLEIDTYSNPISDDPDVDHIAILENGHFEHDRMTTKPIHLKANIEDCQYHQLTIEWNINEQLLTVSLDDQHLISYQKDLAALFKKKGGVYWGVAASTGFGGNTHKVCFDRINISPFDNTNSYFNAAVIEKLKQGEVHTLKQIDFQHDKLKLSSTTLRDLDKLVNLLKANPNKYLDIYSHVHKFDAESSNKVVSEKRAMAIKKYLIKKGIAAKRIQAKGLGALYLSNNDKISRTEIYLFEPLP